MVYNRLLNLLGGDQLALYECRNCGTTLDEDAEECPSCGATEIACYEF